MFRLFLFLLLVLPTELAFAGVVKQDFGRVWSERRYKDTCGDVYSNLSTSSKIGVTGDSLINRAFNTSSADIINSLKYRWTGSSQGEQTCGVTEDQPCEYYLEKNTGATVKIDNPLAVLVNSSVLPFGKIGSLSAGQSGWGDNDSLGNNTIYARLSDGTDPDDFGGTMTMRYDCNSVDRIAAMAIGNQVDHEALDGTYLTGLGSQCWLTLHAIYTCDGSQTNAQYGGDIECGGTNDCDWIITNGGYWDLVGDTTDSCSCGDCDPCDDAGCVATIAAIKSDMSDYIDQIQADSSGARVIIVGYSYLATGAAYDVCLGDLNTALSELADDSTVFFIDPREDNIKPETHPDYFMSDSLHWRRAMMLVIGDKIAEIINAN